MYSLITLYEIPVDDIWQKKIFIKFCALNDFNSQITIAFEYLITRLL